MVTMAQSAAHWRNMHTHMDRTHSLTHSHQHSYKHVVRSASSAVIIIIMKNFNRHNSHGHRGSKCCELGIRNRITHSVLQLGLQCSVHSCTVQGAQVAFTVASTGFCCRRVTVSVRQTFVFKGNDLEEFFLNLVRLKSCVMKAGCRS